MQHNNAHQSVERALNILKAFLPENQELGATEVANALGLHRSTVTRLLLVLAKNEFLQQNPSNKKYSLGRFAVEAGKAISSSLDSHLLSIATPLIDTLRNTLEENVSLEIFSENSTILTYTAKCARLLQVSFRIGDRLPVHVAAGAKAILAFLPKGMVESIIPKKLISFTPNTITNRNAILKQLVEIKTSGIAVDCGERDIDVYAIASPIFDHHSRPIAAVVITAPVSRKDILYEKNTHSLLKETTRKISTQLLYSGKE